MVRARNLRSARCRRRLPPIHARTPPSEPATTATTVVPSASGPSHPVVDLLFYLALRLRLKPSATILPTSPSSLYTIAAVFPHSCIILEVELLPPSLVLFVRRKGGAVEEKRRIEMKKVVSDLNFID